MSLLTPIIVSAVRFTGNFDVVPVRIELDGISYRLDDGYKKVALSNEDGTSTIFDLSDGTHRFRIREDAFNWRLVSMSSLNAL